MPTKSNAGTEVTDQSADSSGDQPQEGGPVLSPNGTAHVVEDPHQPCLFISANIQGLYPVKSKYKVSLLSEITAENNVGFLALTETHLNNDIYDAEVRMPGFEIFRADRGSTTKGGVALYVRENLNSCPEIILKKSAGLVESLAVYMKRLNLLIIVIYRPPAASLQDFSSTINEIQDKMAELPKPTPTVFMTGDFNFPSVSWPDGEIGAAPVEVKAQYDKLQQVTSEYFLTGD